MCFCLFLSTTFPIGLAVFPAIRNVKQTYHLGLNDPRNFGDVHNEIFKKVAEKYRSSISTDKNDVLDNVKASLNELYPDDAAYSKIVEESMAQAVEKFGSGKIDQLITYPDDMGKEIRDIFDKTFQAISGLHRDNLDETLTDIESLQKEAEDMLRYQHPFEQYRTVAALSVAHSSTKLWHGMKYNLDDDSRTLRQLASLNGEQAIDEDYDNRNLQFFGDVGSCIYFVIIVDVVAFLGLSPAGSILAWLWAIPSLVPILIPTLVLSAPLFVVFMVPFILLFVTMSVAASAVGWLAGITLYECDPIFTNRTTL